MRRPGFRIECCLCGKPIAKGSDVNALDEEWQRRYPQMNGTLACTRCVPCDNSYYWVCRAPDGALADGHRPAVHQVGGTCYDSWNHVEATGTHIAMVLAYPWSGLLQGAQEYLRHTAVSSRTNKDVARDLLAVIERFDAQHPPC